ncbi:hypothetical protein NIES2104_06440 [Leptolyngbya sp. NIES-2104]|nr:hypothetical protein NIES2104_06440 [Leptolyngbya sp. NIES-2104]
MTDSSRFAIALKRLFQLCFSCINSIKNAQKLQNLMGYFPQKDTKQVGLLSVKQKVSTLN